MKNRSKAIHGVAIDFIKKKNVDGLRSLLASGLDANSSGRGERTLLIEAAIEHAHSAAAVLLENGADPDRQDAIGMAPLHVAAMERDLDMTQALLATGASVDIEDVHGNTPLSKAVFYFDGNPSVLRALLAAGANGEKKNKHGVSPADMARDSSRSDLAPFFKK